MNCFYLKVFMVENLFLNLVICFLLCLHFITLLITELSHIIPGSYPWWRKFPFLRAYPITEVPGITRWRYKKVYKRQKRKTGLRLPAGCEPSVYGIKRHKRKMPGTIQEPGNKCGSGLGGNRTRVQKPIQRTSTIISCSCGSLPFPHPAREQSIWPVW